MHTLLSSDMLSDGLSRSVMARTLDSVIRNHVWENGHRYHAYKAGSKRCRTS